MQVWGSPVALSRYHLAIAQTLLSISRALQYVYRHSVASMTLISAQLLEDHLEKLKDANAEGVAEDDEAAWEGWDVDSDSSSDDESEGWLDVPDDDDDLMISDSDDEAEKAPKPPNATETTDRISTLATTKVIHGAISVKSYLISVFDVDSYSSRLCLAK